jgi:hypothetical protein
MSRTARKGHSQESSDVPDISKPNIFLLFASFFFSMKNVLHLENIIGKI